MVNDKFNVIEQLPAQTELNRLMVEHNRAALAQREAEHKAHLSQERRVIHDLNPRLLYQPFYYMA